MRRCRCPDLRTTPGTTHAPCAWSSIAQRAPAKGRLAPMSEATQLRPGRAGASSGPAYRGARSGCVSPFCFLRSSSRPAPSS